MSCVIPNGLLAALLLGILLPVTGRHLILGRSILLGLAVPQISMAGIAFLFLGSALGWRWAAGPGDESTQAALGALVFAVPALLLFAALQRAGRHLSEAWLAVAYLGASSAANLMLSNNALGETYLNDLFHGRMILISNAALVWLGSVVGLASVFALTLAHRFLLILVDADFAAVARVRVGAWAMGLALINGVAVGVAVAAAGPLVTFGFLILPALSAASFAGSLRSHLLWSMALGSVTALAGHHCAYHWDLPLGDVTVAIGVGVVVICRLWARMRNCKARSYA